MYIPVLQFLGQMAAEVYATLTDKERIFQPFGATAKLCK